MSKRCGLRFTCPSRRPASFPASRSQVRQRVDQLRELYHLEVALNDLNTAFLSEAMCSIEDKI